MFRKGLWIGIMMLLVAGCSLTLNQDGSQEKENAVPVQATPEEPSMGTPPVPALLTFPEEEYAVKPGAEQELKVLLYDKDGNQMPSPPRDEIEWNYSSDEYIQISADGFITTSENAPIGKQYHLEANWNGLKAEAAIRLWVSAAETIKIWDEKSLPVVTNEHSISVMVNKQRGLPEAFIPQHLSVPNVPFAFSGEHEKQLLQEEAAQALERLFEGAKHADVELYAVSGYRSYERQKAIFQYNVATQGEETARQFSAEPGTSEHQTGLAMDVSSPVVDNRLTQQFGETSEGQWLADHAHEYGFIIRYPQGKEAITGYAWEPWHLRYVGIPLAQDMKQQGLTMEEYFSDERALPVLAQK